MGEEGLETVPTMDLQLRCAILKRIIVENSNDPRVGEPQRQLAIIEAEIQRRMDNPVKVQLKTLSLTGEVRKIGGNHG
jgi:hypothetical protein